MWHSHVYPVWTYWASRSILYFSVSGEDQILYDLSGFDIIYEPGDDASGPDYLVDDYTSGMKIIIDEQFRTKFV